MKNLKQFFTSHWLLLVEAVVVICQSGIDGRYIRSFYPPGILGTILGFGLNLGVDVTSGVLGYEFTRHQQNARKSDRRTKRLAWILLIGEFGLLYFAVVFSHRQLELVMPGEPAYLLWSLSSFAPSACFLIGVAQALRDGKFATEQKARVKQTTQPIEQIIPQVLAPKPYQCQYCEAEYTTVKQLNGHMRAHPLSKRNNGNGKQKELSI